MADALKVNLQDIWDNYTAGYPVGSSRGITILQINASASDIAGVVKKAIRDNEGFLTEEGAEKIKRRLGTLLVYLSAVAVFFGSTPEAVTAKNLNKLADRKARGVLQGSGDNR